MARETPPAASPYLHTKKEKMGRIMKIV